MNMIKDTIADLAYKANDLWEHINGLSGASLEELLGEVEACQSEASDLSTELDGLNDSMDECDDDILDYIPDNLSAGEYDSLKEALNKWRTDNGYPAK